MLRNLGIWAKFKGEVVETEATDEAEDAA